MSISDEDRKRIGEEERFRAEVRVRAEIETKRKVEAEEEAERRRHGKEVQDRAAAEEEAEEAERRRLRKEVQDQEAADNKLRLGFFAFIGLVAVVGVLHDGCGTKTESSNKTSTPVVEHVPTTVGHAINEHTITRADMIGCRSRATRERLTDFVVANDRDAAIRFLASALLKGECTSFEVSETVYLEDSATFAGLVQVRRRGETVSYWTNTEAIY